MVLEGDSRGSPLGLHVRTGPWWRREGCLVTTGKGERLGSALGLCCGGGASVLSVLFGWTRAVIK